MPDARSIRVPVMRALVIVVARVVRMLGGGVGGSAMTEFDSYN